MGAGGLLENQHAGDADIENQAEEDGGARKRVNNRGPLPAEFRSLSTVQPAF
jgi:hypothetical protein